MEKTITINETEYTISNCTAVACCDLKNAAQQDALLVTCYRDGEKVECVVFGYEMPETADDFVAMCEDSFAWESYYEVLETVRV